MNGLLPIIAGPEILLLFAVTACIAVLVLRKIKSHRLISDKLVEEQRQLFQDQYARRSDRVTMPKTLEDYAKSSDQMKRTISIWVPIQLLAFLPLIYSLYDRYALQ
jgi:hypothetical protein